MNLTGTCCAGSIAASDLLATVKNFKNACTVTGHIDISLGDPSSPSHREPQKKIHNKKVSHTNNHVIIYFINNSTFTQINTKHAF